jgi:putative hydrolase of the HAD superfamily
MHTTKYKHLFFDLDRTLWDFDANNKLTFDDLYQKFDLALKGITHFDTFYTDYQHINMALWDAYRKQEITKEDLNYQRFHQSLLLYNIDDSKLAHEIGSYYLLTSPLKTILYPHTLETLEKLHRKYQMHIITNGFEEVQYIKIEKSGLGKFFDKIITSERAGFKKPDKRIFEFAFRQTGATAHNSIIIGDDPESDILGAQQIGMDQIWVMHPPVPQSIGKATFEVECLKDIISIL